MNRLESSTGVADADEIVVWIWVLTAIVCLGLHFKWWGLFFALKAAMDTAESIRYAIREIRSGDEA